MLLLVGLRQTYLTVWAFGAKQKTMMVQHCLLCAICMLRIFVCVVYYMLQYESVRAKIEFKAVAAVSGLPYVLMLWLFSLLVANWASIYYAAKADDLRGIGNAFDKIRPYFFGANLVASVLFISLFTSLALSNDANQRKALTLAGTIIYAIIVLVLSVAYACYGYGLLVQLSKDFKSSSAERLCKVGVVFCVCFAGEAGIWLLSGMAPEVFFANFEVVNSLFFALDLIALCCILMVTRKSLTVGVKNTAAKTLKQPFGVFSRIGKSKTGAMTMKAMSRKSVAGKHSTGGRSTGAGSASGIGSSAGKPGKSPAKKVALNVKQKKGKSRLDKVSQKFAKKTALRRAEIDPDHPSNAAVAVVPRFMLPTSDGGSDGVDVLRKHASFNQIGDMVIDIDSISREGSRSRAASGDFSGKAKKARVAKAKAVELAAQDKLVNKFEHWIEAIDDDGCATAAAALGSRPGNINDVADSSDVNLDDLAAVLFSSDSEQATARAVATDSAADRTGSVDPRDADLFEGWEEGESTLSSDDAAVGVIETDDWMAHVRGALADLDISLSSSSGGSDVSDNLSDLFSFGSSSDSQ
jgi:hypothetical protein